MNTPSKPKGARANAAELRKKVQEEAKKVYDMIIDTGGSLRSLNQGWQLIVKDLQFLTNAKYTESVRPIAVIGDYKVGKTRFIKRLTGDASLKDHEIAHTPGVCLKIYEPTTEKSDSPFGDDDEEKASVRIGLLDTAGADVPADKDDRNDIMAEENFLREFVLQCAKKVIYVTSKYSRASCDAIDALVEALGTPDTTAHAKLSTANQLYVIHNIFNYTKENEEQVFAKEFADLYSTHGQEPDGSWKPGKGPVADNNEPREQLKRNAITGGVFWYETKYVRHFFLASDGSEKGKAHNDKIFAFLKDQLWASVEPDDQFNLVQKFMDYARLTLGDYLNYNSGAIALDLQSAQEETVPQLDPESGFYTDKFVPMVPVQDSQKAANGVNGEVAVSTAVATTIDENTIWQPVTLTGPFELHRLQFFLGGRVGHNRTLRATMRTSPNFFVIDLEVPGLADRSQVSVSLRQIKAITRLFVEANLPDDASKDPKGEPLSTVKRHERRVGRCYYQCDFRPEEQFDRSNITSSMIPGRLTLLLPRSRDAPVILKDAAK